MVRVVSYDMQVAEFDNKMYILLRSGVWCPYCLLLWSIRKRAIKR